MRFYKKEIHYYNLNCSKQNIHNQGALLKISFDSHNYQVFDIFTWNRIKGTKLSELLNQIKTNNIKNEMVKKQFSHLLPPSKHEEKITQHNIQSYKSNKLGPSETYTSINKLKINHRNINQLWKTLENNKEKKFILDFNNCFKLNELISMKEKFHFFKNNITYIEDPTPFKPTDWIKLSNIIKCEFAADHLDELFDPALFKKKAFKHIILKPYKIKINKEWFEEDVPVKFTFTSYLNHPLHYFHQIKESCYWIKKYPDRFNKYHGFDNIHYYDNVFKLNKFCTYDNNIFYINHERIKKEFYEKINWKLL